MIKKCFTITVLRNTEDFDDAEKLLVKTGIFQGCEIFFPYETSEEVKQEYTKNLERFLKYPNFEMVCHLPYGAKNNIATKNNIEKVMERFYQAIDFASLYKVKKLTLHPGELDGSLSYEEALNEAVKNVQKLCDYCSQYQMTIMIENLVGEKELCLSIRQMDEFLRKVARPNVKLILDCGHYHASHQKEEIDRSLSEYVRHFKDQIYHLHLSDNHGTNDEHAPLGTGNIDYVAYFQSLKDWGYQGLYCSEVLFKKYDELLKTANAIDEYSKLLK